MAYEFSVDHGVPIPPEETVIENRDRSKYPFRAMLVGDSFEFPGGALIRVKGAEYQFKRNPVGKGAEFEYRPSTKGSFRVWRVK